MNPLTATAPATTWDFDLAHSSIGFTVRHLVISKVHGRFTRWSGRFEFDPARPEHTAVEVRIDAAGIDTGDAKRDAHLRSPDFFDVENHPTITFRGTRIEPLGKDRYQLAGELSIAGVTKPVALEVETLGLAKDPWGVEHAGFSARTSIDRRDFGLVWNQTLETGGMLVGDKIEIAIELEATKRVAGSEAA